MNEKNRKYIYIGAAVILVIILCLTVFLITKNIYGNKTVTEYVEKIVEIPSEVPVEVEVEVEKQITSDMISSSISNIGQLATQEMTFTQVETFESNVTINEFDIPLTKSKLIYSYDGEIKAGINFEDVEVEKDDEARQISVYIPHSELLSTEIDTESFELYDEKVSIFNKISMEDISVSLDELVKKAEEKSISKGILKKADENAKKLIENFLKGTFEIDGYKIKVFFKED